jgi:hypothetical protein
MDGQMSYDIDATIYPLSLADHKPVETQADLYDPARESTEVEKRLGLVPGEELDMAWYKGVSPLQLQQRDARRRAHYLFLKRL